MNFVMDASDTGSWVFADERTPETDAILLELRDGRAFVPALWPTEVANALLTGIKQRRLTVEGSRDFLFMLSNTRITVRPATGAWNDLLLSAISHGLTVYDATYLDLALELNLPLATMDKQIRVAAEKLGVSLLPV